MPLDWSIPQLLLRYDANGPKVLGQSSGVTLALESAALNVAARYGRPTAEALFVVDLPEGRVGVVQTTPDRLRFLLLNQNAYRLLGDPFAIADHFPMPSHDGPLETLEWPGEQLPARNVNTIMEILRTGDMPWLLGGAQVLLDGGRLVFESRAVDVRNLWQLLPDRTRAELRPATLAHNLDLDFHITGLLKLPETLPPNVLTPDQTRDYPEGRYELALQVAAEAGDQADLDRLFARRTSSDTLRLVLTITGLAFGVAIIVKLAF
jgi:hypothetical protein